MNKFIKRYAEYLLQRERRITLRDLGKEFGITPEGVFRRAKSYKEEIDECLKKLKARKGKI